MDKKWREEYYKKVVDINCAYSEIKEFLKPYLPSKLYRYYSIDAEGFWKKNIKGAIHFSLPSQYNDPFDSSIKINVQEFEKVYTYGDKISFDSKEQINNYLLKTIREVSCKIQEEFYTACFSSSYNQILMWSHYADKHTGFCIEYDCTEGFLLRNMLYPIIYQNNRYDATDIYFIEENLRKNIHANPLLFKALEWKYEDEWRVFISKDCNNENSFLDRDNNYYLPRPRTIYLGINFDSTKNKEFIENCNSLGINLIKMKMNDSTFEIEKSF